MSNVHIADCESICVACSESETSLSVCGFETRRTEMLAGASIPIWTRPRPIETTQTVIESEMKSFWPQRLVSTSISKLLLSRYATRGQVLCVRQQNVASHPVSPSTIELFSYSAGGSRCSATFPRQGDSPPCSSSGGKLSATHGTVCNVTHISPVGLEFPVQNRRHEF